MKRWVCALLAGVLALVCGAGALAEEDYDAYYDRFANVEADICIGEVGADFENSGRSDPFEDCRREEEDNGIVFISRTTSLSVLALVSEDWNGVAAFLVMAMDPADYGLGLDVLCRLENDYHMIFDSRDESASCERWLGGLRDEITSCGVQGRLQKWETTLDTGSRLQISVTPLPECNRLNAVLYITDEYEIDIYMGA